VVATLRNPDGGEAHDPIRLQLMRYAHTVPLAAFDDEQVGALVGELAGQAPSPELAGAVRRATGGVPLFVEEVVRTLSHAHGRDALAKLPPDAVRVPKLARDLLRERIGRLPPETVHVLSCAAAIGERFDLSLLTELTALDPEALLDRLDPARAEGQLASDAPHVYRFVHALYQTVLYEDVPAAQRVSLHQRIGVLLEARPDAAQRSGEIAGGRQGQSRFCRRHGVQRVRQRAYGIERIRLQRRWQIQHKLVQPVEGNLYVRRG
jgi:predicted ATPase